MTKVFWCFLLILFRIDQPMQMEAQHWIWPISSPNKYFIDFFPLNFLERLMLCRYNFMNIKSWKLYMKTEFYFLAKMAPCLWKLVLKSGRFAATSYDLCSLTLLLFGAAACSCFLGLTLHKPGSPQDDAWPQINRLSSCSQEFRLGTDRGDSLRDQLGVTASYHRYEDGGMCRPSRQTRMKKCSHETWDQRERISWLPGPSSLFPGPGKAQFPIFDLEFHASFLTNFYLR